MITFILTWVRMWAQGHQEAYSQKNRMHRMSTTLNCQPPLHSKGIFKSTVNVHVATKITFFVWFVFLNSTAKQAMKARRCLSENFKLIFHCYSEVELFMLFCTLLHCLWTRQSIGKRGSGAWLVFCDKTCDIVFVWRRHCPHSIQSNIIQNPLRCVCISGYSYK